jgi:predicted PurR-regulated permease PerM
VWGLLAFVLNFIPTLGSLIAAIVPALVATLFQGPAIGAATLAGLAVIQTILGNFVDPKLQGTYLKLSPFVALLSIVFWGWVWGIPGAFIGVPMTAAVMLFANEFKSSRPIAIMLGGSD